MKSIKTDLIDYILEHSDEIESDIEKFDAMLSFCDSHNIFVAETLDRPQPYQQLHGFLKEGETVDKVYDWLARQPPICVAYKPLKFQFKDIDEAIIGFELYIFHHGHAFLIDFGMSAYFRLLDEQGYEIYDNEQEEVNTDEDYETDPEFEDHVYEHWELFEQEATEASNKLTEMVLATGEITLGSSEEEAQAVAERLCTKEMKSKFVGDFIDCYWCAGLTVLDFLREQRKEELTEIAKTDARLMLARNSEQRITLCQKILEDAGEDLAGLRHDDLDNIFKHSRDYYEVEILPDLVKEKYEAGDSYKSIADSLGITVHRVKKVVAILNL